MSKPIRYGLADADLGRIHPQADGHLVMWSDYADLAAENERLRSASFVTAVPSEEYERLKDENERLRGKIEAMRIAGDALEARRYIVDRCKHSTESEEWERAKKGLPSLAQQWDREKANRLAAENERLRKAGDTLAFYAQEDGTGWELHAAAKDWNAAKEGRDAK